jgi:hypothetical protein
MGKAPEKDGNRQLFMVVGLIAVHDAQDYKSDHQYIVYGLRPDTLNLILDPVDRTKEVGDMTATQMLMTPLWKV